MFEAMAQVRKGLHKEVFYDNLTQMDPPCACQWTPPPSLERRNMPPPFVNGPPLLVSQLALARTPSPKKEFSSAHIKGRWGDLWYQG